jgi:hypothetical protein
VFTLRPYQSDLATQGVTLLQTLKICYLAMEVRTGKTLTALAIARDYGAKRVLFLTKKKAIVSVQKDFDAMAPGYELVLINDESIHKVAGNFDLVIHDEHHRFGAFPKPGATAKLFKKMFGHLPMIFLSGTPTPEGYSQIYHQFWVSTRSPFTEPSFYKWARTYVNVTQKHLGHGVINDYTKAKLDLIAPVIEPYMLRYTQRDAGFESVISEQVVWVEPSPVIKQICGILQKDLFVKGNDYTITADSPVKLQSKLHQLYSGTILFDEKPGESQHALTLDTSKAEAIKQNFPDQKLVIFYKFKQELAAIKSVLDVTTDIAEFRSSPKSIALQIVTGREGINLSEAEAIVFYNIDFSATSYWQARDRMTTIDRPESKVYWLFSVGGIEEKIYGAVTRKKSYTVNMFRKDFGIRHPSIADQKIRKPGLLRSQTNQQQQTGDARSNASQARQGVLC